MFITKTVAETILRADRERAEAIHKFMLREAARLAFWAGLPARIVADHERRAVRQRHLLGVGAS